MKMIVRAIALLMVLIGLASARAVQAETLTTLVPLSSSNVVPPATGVNGSASVALTFDINRSSTGDITGATVNFRLIFNFPGPVTIAGFPLREGDATSNGPEVINVDGNSQAFFLNGSGILDLSTDVTDTALLRRVIGNPSRFYINLNTTDRPMGALRGQLTTLVESRSNTLTLLPGAVVNPPAPLPSSASATATITIHPTRNPATGAITGGTVNFTALYNFPGSVTIRGLRIHEAAAGANGPAVFDAGAGSPDPVISSSGKGGMNLQIPVNGAGPIGALQRLLANPAGFYIVLLTAANPEGAVRAQLKSLANPPENFFASAYTLPVGNTARTLDITGINNGSISVLLNGAQGVITSTQPGAFTVQVPGSMLSNPGLLFVELEDAFGVRSEPLIVVVVAPEKINSTAAAAVDAARFGQGLAPESIAAVFGTQLATQTAVSSSTPLATTLDGTSVFVDGRPAPLFFVSPTQINFQVPPGTLPGSAVSILIMNKNGDVSRGTIPVTATAPGIFTGRSNGTGAPAGVASSDGRNFNQLLSNADGTPVAIDAGNFAVLFGTGFRFASGAVAISIGGTPVTPLFAGPQGQLVGLEQINLQIPTSLAGRGDVDLELTVDGKKANPVRLRIK